MKKLVFGVALVGALSCTALAHKGHEHATGVVRERMELMTEMGQKLLAMSRQLRANKDLDRIAKDAGPMRELAGKIVSQFPPGSIQAPTAAKPAIWQNWDDFSEKSKNLQTQLEKLSGTSSLDGNALRAQFRAVGYACDACHEKYRVPKESGR